MNTNNERTNVHYIFLWYIRLCTEPLTSFDFMAIALSIKNTRNNSSTRTQTQTIKWNSFSKTQ